MVVFREESLGAARLGARGVGAVSVLFEAQVQCRITNATTLDDLRSELEAIATEIMVDIDLVDRS